MSFWKVFFTYIITKIIADNTIFKIDFFHYSLMDNFSMVSILRFLVEIISFTLIYLSIYYLVSNFSNWKMRIKYELAHKKK
ncbi:hypothetical protein WAX74_12210 [Psychrobacillus sp. FJAT-51614]|uniref:Uncharacterized protein n=1 Tax=Psychrobacillus mangrovi TaxID=3117745 RepID=A0ABU8F5X2_9BACI